jgi:hypothetical protein
MDTSRLVSLIDARQSNAVSIDAFVIRDLDPERLVASEERWGPGRGIVKEAMTRLGKYMENSHWDWRNKVERVVEGKLLLTGLECEGELQGLVALATLPRYSCLTAGSQAMYIDYIETAPWNLRIPGPPRFEGVGTILLADAILLSRELGHEGRVSLHSLPSAESWYLKRCRMTDLGQDPAYYDLRCFEYTSDAASEWLVAKGVSI